MKISVLNKVCFVLIVILLFTQLFVGLTSSAPYDPWYDLDDDGDIDIFDIVDIAGRYGTAGTPINKTSLLFELQARLDSLNASYIDLLAHLEALEVRIAASESPACNLIVTNYENKTVMKLDPDGNIIWSVGLGSTAIETCWNPTDGSIYVLSYHNLTRLYSNGSQMWTKDISSMIVPSVGGPSNIDIDPNDGSVYLVALGGLGGPFGAYKYASNGTLLWFIQATSSNDVQSVAIDPTDGSVYMNGYITGVFKYDPNGTMIWHTPIPGGYQNSYGSHSIAVDPSDGSIVALMRFSGPATKMDADGNIIWQTFFTSDKSRIEIDPYRNAVYILGVAHLHKICLANGNVTWGRSLATNFQGIAPNLKDGSVYLGGFTDQTLYRVDPHDGNITWSKNLNHYVYDLTFEFKLVPFEYDK